MFNGRNREARTFLEKEVARSGSFFVHCRCMRTFISLLLWLLLLAVCWPLAIAAFFLFPLFWLLLLPFRIVGLSLDIVFSLIKSIILFPFKLLRAG